jgi:membrane protease YdiL (CAAX protease family)
MRKALTITKANDLYLVSLLLLLTVGAVAQQVHFSLGLILTEILCIFLPAWWMLRWQKVEIKTSARLRWPGWGVALLSLLLGLAAWQVGTVLDGLMAQLLGYTPGISPSALPQTAGQSVLFFIALAVFPPLCEEFLFRGVLIRSWERKSARVAMIAGAMLFAFYHLRLQGLVGLIPVAFLLTYLVLRSNSLVSGILAHFANNTLAALVTILAIQQPDLKLPFPSLPAAGIGLVVLIAGVWLLRRITPAPEPFQPGVEQPEPKAKGIVRTAPHTRTLMPLILTGIIYLFMAGYELVGSKYPDLLAEGKLVLSQPVLSQPLKLEYEVRNPLDAPIGMAECTLTPMEMQVKLDCSKTAEGYQTQVGSSYWASESYSEQWSATWLGVAYGLDAYRVEYNGENSSRIYWLEKQDSGLLIKIETPDANHSINLIYSTLVEEEWPWRLMGLEFQPALARKAVFISPLSYQPDLNISGPSTHDLAVTVIGADFVRTPAGNFIAWKVKVGDEGTAWYEVQAPHRLIKLETQFETLVLK